ncbi:MAG: hypothetical protein J6X28_05190 [Bacilli bacterium]|nr:hypothetical protein [Bacilli bacterium]
MEDMHFSSNEDLLDYIRSHAVKHFNPGREGNCTLLDNGWIVKYLWREYYPKFALQFKDFQVPTFVFAQYGAFVDDMVKAVFMEYAEGPTVSQEKPVTQKMTILGEQLEAVLEDLYQISDRGVLVDDFHCGNLIYNGEQFKIIDTLPSYLLLPGGKYRKDNFYQVMPPIYDMILQDLMKFSFVREYHTCYGNKRALEHPKDYYQSLRDQIAQDTHQEIITLEDAHQALQKKYPH